MVKILTDPCQMFVPVTSTNLMPHWVHFSSLQELCFHYHLNYFQNMVS